MARKVGQIIARGHRRWLIRIYLGRDHETKQRKYHNRTIHGPMREAQVSNQEAARKAIWGGTWRAPRSRSHFACSNRSRHSLSYQRETLIGVDIGVVTTYVP